MDDTEQQVLIEQALQRYWRATELTGDYDPGEDTRVDAPHQALVELTSAPVANAVGSLFRLIRGEAVEI